MRDPLTLANTRHTPQTLQADPAQAPNNAGGFAFTVDEATRLRRFLTLGVAGGTFYVSERDLTLPNTDLVLRWARERTAELVDELVAVSVAGRAPKVHPQLFALAAAASLGDADGRRAALDALPRVARTGTHLFLFARYVEQFRGWGRGLRRAVAGWYNDKPVDAVAYQAVKYRQREGWSHRDLLRLAHPAASEPARRALYDFMCGRESDVAGLPVVDGFRRARHTSDPAVWARLVGECGLSWEMLPDQALTEPAVWEALVDAGMPQGALLRQLPRLTRLGVLTQMGERTGRVCEQLADPDRLRKARVHPVDVLLAHHTYAAGRSLRGDSKWEPVARIVDALDAAFYAAFGAVEPTGKRTLLALDVSRSMGQCIPGPPDNKGRRTPLPLTCREASAALALVTAATEPRHQIVGFTSASGRDFGPTQLTELAISPRQRLADAVAAVDGLPFGGTDCSMPMLWALDHGVPVDTFVVYTDNETWAGNMHPHQALARYRERMGIDARMVVVGMTATDVSIADPADPGMLDVAGFDAAAPTLVADFARGDV